MVGDNVLVDKTISFSIRIVKCYNYLQDEKKEVVMSKQLLRSGTSIGANVHEAIFAVQWHPEAMLMADNGMLPIWHYFLAECGTNRA